MLWARVIWKELGPKIFEDVIARTCANREKSMIYWPDGIKDERKAMEGKSEIKIRKEFTLIKFIIESGNIYFFLFKRFSFKRYILNTL